jgi:hypothetical protein
MVARATGDDLDCLGPVEQGLDCMAEARLEQAPLVDAAFQGLGHHGRLLEDLLLHVVAVGSLLGMPRRQATGVHGARLRPAFGVEHGDAVAPDLGQVTLCQEHETLGDR